MNQLTFKFPFKASYYEKDFYVSSNNFLAYKLVESWPQWTTKYINICGPHGCGKTHLANILKIKTNSLLTTSINLSEKTFDKLKSKECLIIEDFNNDINEKLLYTTINFINQTNKFLVINSTVPVKKMKINLKDLKSRFDSFTVLSIDLPTDELLRVIITKSFSDKQIEINVKLLEYVIKNIERSYEKVFKFIVDIDKASLSAGKSININLIKKVLNEK